jgi:hypothetical protein
MTLSSILETANHSAAIDTILHNNALAMVEAILKSAIRDPSTETSGVSSSFLSLIKLIDRAYGRQLYVVLLYSQMSFASRLCRRRRAG